MRRGLAGAVLCAIVVVLGQVVAQAEDFPARTIRFIVPSPPGGGTDIIARSLAQKFSERAGFAAVVENKIGAGSLVGTDYVAKAPPDGYTLMVGGLFTW